MICLTRRPYSLWVSELNATLRICFQCEKLKAEPTDLNAQVFLSYSHAKFYNYSAFTCIYLQIFTDVYPKTQLSNKTLTIEDKLRALKPLDNSKSINILAEELNVQKSMIYDWKKIIGIWKNTHLMLLTNVSKPY